MPIPIEHNPVLTSDFRAVFQVLGVIDGHPRTADDVEAWMLAARTGRWTRAQVAAATFALTTTFTGFRVQPGHLAEQIRANRARIRGLWECPPPPRELADDPAAELAWRRRAAVDFADRALLALAAGDRPEDVPLLATPEPPVQRLLLAEAPPEVRTEIEAAMPALGRLPEPRPTPHRTPRAATDPARRAQARAELDARRPTDTDSTPAELREDATA
ncbi:hypothetical protein [Pseudonocardia sp. NPDC049635]|uniref:hypothetical protein n=1 Tax=Pseudonocardia sp. NPDC049635 TaxID=3155506 RepID=UPI0033DB47AD